MGICWCFDIVGSCCSRLSIVVIICIILYKEEGFIVGVVVYWILGVDFDYDQACVCIVEIDVCVVYIRLIVQVVDGIGDFVRVVCKVVDYKVICLYIIDIVVCYVIVIRIVGIQFYCQFVQVGQGRC